MAKSRLRPLDLALQIGDSFTAVDIHGDGQVSAVDKPRERIDGAPGPRLREWWHHYEYAFAEYQPIDVIALAVDFHSRIFGRHYRARARVTARLIYGSFDEDGMFSAKIENGSPVYDWITTAQAEKMASRMKDTGRKALSEDLHRNQEGESRKVVSSRGGTHDAMVDTLEYQLQAPRNWRVSDW